MFSPSLSPHHPDELYVSCDMGPEFHSMDFGRSWETLHFRQFVGNNGSAIRFTKNPDVMWSLDYRVQGGGDTCRPTRTTDQGKSWKRSAEQAWPLSRRAYVLCADFANPDRAFVTADYCELWATQDGGRSYNLKYRTDSSSGLVLGGVFCDGDVIYIGTSDGLLISHDGGRTIKKTNIGGFEPGQHLVNMAGAKSESKVRLFGVVYDQVWAGMTGQENGFYRGVYVLDAGQSLWKRRSEGIDATKSAPFYVAACPSDIDTCYVAGGFKYPSSGPCVHKTTDGGGKWESVFLVDANRNMATGWAGDGGQFRWSFPEYCLGLDVSPIDKNRVVITDLSCVHGTADGGKSWSALYTTTSASRSLGQPTPRDDTYQGKGLEPTSVWWLCWMDRQTIMAGYTDVRGLRSTDGGKLWGWNYTGQDLNTTYHVMKHPTRGIAFLANSSVHDMYRSTYLTDARIDEGKGSVLYSTDQGTTWKLMRDCSHPVIWLAFDGKRPTRMMASIIHSRDGGIYLTDDADKLEAARWTRLAAPPRTEGHPMNCYFLDDGSLLVSYSGRRGKEFSASSGVFLSTDNGRTWQDRSDPALRYWVKELVLDPHDKDQKTWYAGTFLAWGKTEEAARHSGLYRSKDRGKTWTCIADKSIAPSGALNVNSCTISPVNPDELYFATEYDGLFNTSNLRDAQPAFRQVKSYPFGNPTRVFFNPFDVSEIWVTSFGNGLYVGTASKGLKPR
jgi:photosystem II stability/assembly factor-like uncharacterized protein